MQPLSRFPMPAPGDRLPSRRGWAVAGAAVTTWLAVVSVVWTAALPAGAPTRSVHLAPEAVILASSDIPDMGWGLRASGSNGTGVWRLFSVHNELILAFLNLTLWVEGDAATAAQRFAVIAGSAAYPTQDAGVANADASAYWSAGSSPYAGIVVRRYNVVFVMTAYLESSWYLTKSDLGSWSGWQLAKIEWAALQSERV